MPIILCGKEFVLIVIHRVSARPNPLCDFLMPPGIIHFPRRFQRLETITPSGLASNSRGLVNKERRVARAVVSMTKRLERKHPQTLLCYEMNGEPLTLEHGAPLRLVTPVKYGIKNIKRIGTIRFTDKRPADFWAERGYDWYAGH